jgi:hypothetical protein
MHHKQPTTTAVPAMLISLVCLFIGTKSTTYSDLCLSLQLNNNNKFIYFNCAFSKSKWVQTRSHIPSATIPGAEERGVRLTYVCLPTAEDSESVHTFSHSYGGCAGKWSLSGKRESRSAALLDIFLAKERVGTTVRPSYDERV